jgi:single-stranded DNA-binding protein
MYELNTVIYLEGKIKTQNSEDKTGIKRYVTEIVAESLIMFDKSNGRGAYKAEINASFNK